MSAWTDQSGLGDSGRNQSAAGALRPGYTANDAAYGNQPVLTFSGSQAMASGTFNASVATAVSVVMIGQITTDSGAFSDGSTGDMIFKSGGNVYFYGAAQGSSPLATATVTSPCCIMFTDDGTGGGSAAKIYVNDTTTVAAAGPTNWSSTTVFDVGQDVVAVGKLIGKIAELIVFGGVLTAPDVAHLVTYFNSTRAYGIAIT